jgi:hypothetical protein
VNNKHVGILHSEGLGEKVQVKIQKSFKSNKVVDNRPREKVRRSIILPQKI